MKRSSRRGARSSRSKKRRKPSPDALKEQLRFRNGGDIVQKILDLDLDPEETEALVEIVNGAVQEHMEQLFKKSVYPNGFCPRPPHIPPYTRHQVLTMNAAKYDEATFQKETAREGWKVAALKYAWDAGYSYETVAIRMLYLPTVIHLGGKEIKWNSHEAKAVITFMHVAGIVYGLLGISSVTGGGDGAMAQAAKGHVEGIEIAKRSGFRRLFAKCGNANVLLAIREESPNPFVTSGWMVRPTRELSIRKARLFGLGLPMHAHFFPGGDATFDEFDYVKTLTKPVLRNQLETPFDFVCPAVSFIDPKRKDPAVPECWESFLQGYADRMVTGTPERQKRKRRECDELTASHFQIGCIDDALAATRRIMERLIEPVAVSTYNAPFVETWEVLNEGHDFWETAERLARTNAVDFRH